MYSLIIKPKAQFDASRIELRFILFIPLETKEAIIKCSLLFSRRKHRLHISEGVLGIVNVKQRTMEKRGKQTEQSSALFTHQLVTLADLEKFKEQMLSEMRKLLAGGGAQLAKQWLKSREVRKLLDVSPGKLHAMRASRQLSFMRIGGVIYYDRADIDRMFERSKTIAVK
ncbi:helix-turn-helix domain-containing protein [Dyadobacter sp. Leaf189]|uniref:helix-turn-helix domain-containing protein n=1 Tax=Dyadobacter sp. Leaf189 TaxID=1736295 RepID=UPI001E436CE9|nr:helix-turn-helix domain-containing protein [Dyadobacter sp. Leaf189]